MVDRTILLVVGMHRSGTSYAGSVCSHVGLQSVGPLIRGDSWNRPGYFESLEIAQAQDGLLTELQRPWWDLSPLPADWIDTPAARRCEDRIVAAIERFAPEGDLFIKDPRTSLILPLWERLRTRLGARIAALVCVRRAAAVSQSLSARDNINFIFGLMLWWRYQGAVARYLAGGTIDAVGIPYEKARDNPGLIVEALAALLGEGYRVSDAAGLEALGRPGLDHSRDADFTLHDHPLNKACNDAYAIVASSDWQTRFPAIGDEQAAGIMEWYPTWRTLYEHHARLLNVTRGVYSRLAGYRSIAGPAD